MRAPCFVVVLILIGCLCCCSVPRRGTDLVGFVPHEVLGWRDDGGGQYYDRATIFDYIDGAGEVYLQYAFERVFVREFSRRESPAISAQVFDMGTPADAFGIFSLEREDADAGIGRDSEYSGGLLRFWKNRFFVCVSAEAETPGTREAVLALGRAIAAAIPEPGDRPALLRKLPPGNLVATTVRYFHAPHGLASHFPVSGMNALALSAETEALLASYRFEGGAARLLLVRYPDAGRADAAMRNFSAGHVPPLGTDGTVMSSDSRWTGVSRTGRVVVIVEAPSRDSLETLVNGTATRLESSS
jgi:hypothetical protein